MVAPELAAIKVEGMSRESFLIRATLAAGATYGALSATPYITKALAAGGGFANDLAVVNYALTLEYLESTFYRMGVLVKGLSSDELKLVKQIRDDEDQHVTALIAAAKKLGGKPVAKPKFDFGGAFGDRATFLKTANTLEDAGVSAYNGAGMYIESPDILGAAGSIVQIEGRHSALIRLTRNKPPAPQAFDKGATMAAILKKVGPLIKS
ncbi:MAG TPA: ferritin-like domain-containing protein [Solirubrobacteraceae bacterium]|jgi:hypothetical protein